MTARGFLRMTAGAGVGALALALTLTGCAAWAGPADGPPTEVTTVVDEALTEIRATPGVASVTADIRVSDGFAQSDKSPTAPDLWDAHFTVQADDSNVDVPALAVSVDSAAQNGTVSMSSVVRIPGEKGGADVSLSFSPPGIGVITSLDPEQMADAAVALCDLPGTLSVSVFQHGEPVGIGVESASVWADLTTTVRALPGFGSGALPAITLTSPADGSSEGSSLTIDPTSPGTGLVRFLAELSTDLAVTSVYFDGVDNRKDSAAWRPNLRVRVAALGDVEDVAGLLTELDDSQTQVEGLPLASFDVSLAPATATDSPETLTGYLGLPLGSAEPDDRLAGLPGATPPAVVDPADATTRIAGDLALVTALLDAAGDEAGIRGPASVTTTTCTGGSDEQVTGSVVIPIFEIADSADEAFDAITTAWEISGFSRSDRAMGTDFYSVPDGSLETLSIRGTAAGISINATAPCVRSR
ncbi:hypothetical protein [Cryobacterium sp. LW097]|uniref:hypothetical protein n=1 Tax=Cryobacterium sp. LW097 TaxID=1978566 RepID=UPI0012468C88|nr:hypothetical protein [Cryobacterium sp. LW097]